MTSLSRLTLHHFRNYPSLELELGPEPVVLTGPNGAGKTNILEAISLLSPGRGLRGAVLSELDYQPSLASLPVPWALSVMLHTKEGKQQIGTGRDAAANKRIIKIDGQLSRGHAALSAVLSVMWLTPQMDLLFLSGASVRRKFLDRLVYHFDIEHASRVTLYEQAMRERARLLKDRKQDATWFSVLEERMASLGVAIAASRLDTLAKVTQAMLDNPSPFPKASLHIEGEIETLLASIPALQVEGWYQEKLAKNRLLDMHSGRTSAGVHRSDLLVSHAFKNRLAAYCSTGEQKSLLLSILLAHVRARVAWRHSVPVILLDEVVAHLDERKRGLLLEELQSMNVQFWLTGTDESVFQSLKKKAQFFSVEQGTVQHSLQAFEAMGALNSS